MTTFKEAVAAEKPLQVVGAINANHALLAKRAGYKAIYLSGGGVAAGSLGLPDLGITTLDDVLTDVRRITNVCDLPLLVDIDTGFGTSAFNITRTVKEIEKAGASAIHMEDQVAAKRCGHRPNKEIVSAPEMVDAPFVVGNSSSDISAKGDHTIKRVPTPNWLVTSIWPFINSNRRRTMTKPMPVPSIPVFSAPKRLKGSNRCSHCSGLKPRPVSVTSIAI